MSKYSALDHFFGKPSADLSKAMLHFVRNLTKEQSKRLGEAEDQMKELIAMMKEEGKWKS